METGKQTDAFAIQKAGGVNSEKQNAIPAHHQHLVCIQYTRYYTCWSLTYLQQLMKPQSAVESVQKLRQQLQRHQHAASRGSGQYEARQLLLRGESPRPPLVAPSRMHLVHLIDAPSAIKCNSTTHTHTHTSARMHPVHSFDALSAINAAEPPPAVSLMPTCATLIDLIAYHVTSARVKCSRVLQCRSRQVKREALGTPMPKHHCRGRLGCF